jgi:DNA polymerase III gamma/tau subunit
MNSLTFIFIKNLIPGCMNQLFILWIFIHKKLTTNLLVLVSKEDMEKLRQALKTLSEAEKQLRMSNDKLTWLTAALLQLAPDQQYLLPSSSTETSFNHSPLAQNNMGGRDISRKGGEHEMPNNGRDLPMHVRLESLPGGTSADFRNNGSTNGTSIDRKRNAASVMAPQWTPVQTSDAIRVNSRQVSGKSHKGYEEIWLEVLEKIQINSMREFLYQEGKLISVSFGAGTPYISFTCIFHLHILCHSNLHLHIVVVSTLVL